MKLETAFGPWYGLFKPLLNSDMFRHIGATIQEQHSKGIQILPGFDKTFRAFTVCPPQNLKVVVVNPAPYSEPGLADGLAWSTGSEILPMAQFHLQKAMLQAEGQKPIQPAPMDLTWLGKQGVLLLNAAFTCEPSHSMAHFHLWKPFTELVLEYISNNFRNIIFILPGIGSYFAEYIDETRNTVLTCAPVERAQSTNVPWEHYQIFTRTNKLLTHFGKDPISWVQQEHAVEAA